MLGQKVGFHNVFHPFIDNFPCFTDFLPFSKQQILAFSKLKEIAENNFTFYENDGKFSERVENTMGKGDIGHLDLWTNFTDICWI